MQFSNNRNKSLFLNISSINYWRRQWAYSN